MNCQIRLQKSSKQQKVAIKLISSKVYNFEIDKSMKVSDFKLLISSETKIPTNKIIMMFYGKQLLNPQLICEYVRQCGVIVHLVGKSATLNSEHLLQQIQRPTTATENLSSLPYQPPPQIQTTNNMIIIRQEINLPLEDFNNNLSLSQSSFPTNSQFVFGQQGGLNGPISMSFSDPNTNSFGNIQISVSQQLQQIPQQIPQQSPQQIPQQSPQSQQQQQQQQYNNQQRVSYSQMQTLNQQLNNLNGNINITESYEETLTPEAVIRYLRYLYYQSSYSMLHLNKLVNQAQNRNTSNLQTFIPVFQSLNSANNVAMNYIKKLGNRNTQQQPQQQTQDNRQIFQQISEMLSGNQNDQQNITLVEINVQPEEYQQQEQLQHQQQQLQNQISISQKSSQDNLFIIFEGLNKMLAMSLKQIISLSGSKYNGVLIELFGELTGQNMIQILMINNLTNLKKKQNQIKAILKKCIHQNGQKYVIQSISKDIANLFIPSTPSSMITNLNQCREKCLTHLTRKIKKLMSLFLSENATEHYLKILDITKSSLYEIMSTISNYTLAKNANSARQIIKTQMLRVTEPILKKNANIFYGLIQKDLMKIYHQYKSRKNKIIPYQNIANEEELIDMIEEGGERDWEKLRNMDHSMYYYKQS